MISIRLYGAFSRPGEPTRKAELLVFPGECPDHPAFTPGNVRLVIRRKGSTLHMIEVDRHELAYALDLLPTTDTP